MTNAVDSFINAIVEGLTKHEGFNEHIKGVVSNDGFTDDHLDNKIAEWMRYNFDLGDYHFDITDYNYDIYGMIDEHLDDESIREKVTEVLGDITVGFEIK
jgi:hypothetical protein